MTFIAHHHDRAVGNAQRGSRHAHRVNLVEHLRRHKNGVGVGIFKQQQGAWIQ